MSLADLNKSNEEKGDTVSRKGTLSRLKKAVSLTSLSGSGDKEKKSKKVWVEIDDILLCGLTQGSLDFRDFGLLLCLCACQIQRVFKDQFVKIISTDLDCSIRSRSARRSLYSSGL